MIACNCCPTPDGCKEYGECLNALALLKQSGKWPFPQSVGSTAPVWNTPAPIVKAACWHDFGPSLAPINGIVTARNCLHCGQSEF